MEEVEGKMVDETVEETVTAVEIIGEAVVVVIMCLKESGSPENHVSYSTTVTVITRNARGPRTVRQLAYLSLEPSQQISESDLQP